MVKTLEITFDDEEYKVLLEVKGETSWHDFIMGLAIILKHIREKSDRATVKQPLSERTPDELIRDDDAHSKATDSMRVKRTKGKGRMEGVSEPIGGWPKGRSDGGYEELCKLILEGATPEDRLRLKQMKEDRERREKVGQ